MSPGHARRGHQALLVVLRHRDTIAIRAAAVAHLRCCAQWWGSAALISCIRVAECLTGQQGRMLDACPSFAESSMTVASTLIEVPWPVRGP